MRESQKSPNPFHRTEPHRNLPMQVRRVLWSACELVLATPGDFVPALQWLDEAFSEQTIREREERNCGIPERSTDRGWRLEQAVREVIAAGLPTGEDPYPNAHRIVLLACLLSYHRELPLPGEFACWTWENAGSSFAAWLDRELSETYFAGRSSVLFGASPDSPSPDWLDAFMPLVKRAVLVLEGTTKDPWALREQGSVSSRR